MDLNVYGRIGDREHGRALVEFNQGHEIMARAAHRHAAEAPETEVFELAESVETAVEPEAMPVFQYRAPEPIIGSWALCNASAPAQTEIYRLWR